MDYIVGNKGSHMENHTEKMSGDSIATKDIKVYVQENGIIRLKEGKNKGSLIGRIENISYKDLEETIDEEGGKMKKQKQVCKGLEVSQGDDGHWITFESGGRWGSINVEEVFGKPHSKGGIVYIAIMGWITEQLEEPEKEKIEISKELLNEIIKYIETKEVERDLERQRYRLLEQIIKGEDMPEIYTKLIDKRSEQ